MSLKLDETARRIALWNLILATAQVLKDSDSFSAEGVIRDANAGIQFETDTLKRECSMISGASFKVESGVEE